MKRFLLLCSLLLASVAFAEEALPELEVKKIDEGVYLHTS